MSADNQARLDAQTAILGAMLIDPNKVGPVLAEVCAADFEAPARTVFEAIETIFLSGGAVDPVTVLAQLGGGQDYEGYIRQLITITPTAANAGIYCKLLKKTSLCAKLQAIGSKLIDCTDPETAEALIGEAGNLLAGRGEQKTYTMTELLSRFYERHSNDIVPVYWAWPLEDLTRNVYAEKGDFIVLGGYPSDGKTSLALWFAYKMAEHHRVGFFSYETGRDKVFDRLTAMRTAVPLPEIKKNKISDDGWDRIAHASTEITSRKLEIIEASGWTVPQIRAKALAGRYDIVYIDYLQKIPAPAQSHLNDFERVTAVSSGLQNFGRQTGVTVLALSQFSRPEKSKSGKVPPPTLASFRQSGQIEQDADVAFLLYREDSDKPDSRRILNIAKNKEGEANIGFFLSFDGPTQSFKKSVVQAPKPSLPKGKPRQTMNTAAAFVRDDSLPIPEEFQQTEIKT